MFSGISRSYDPYSVPSVLANHPLTPSEQMTFQAKKNFENIQAAHKDETHDGPNKYDQIIKENKAAEKKIKSVDKLMGIRDKGDAKDGDEATIEALCK